MDGYIPETILIAVTVIVFKDGTFCVHFDF
jgi:hypothetical protein